MPEYLPCPATEEQLKRIANDFETKWQFNHCLGAIDGKHVVMQAPARSGSMFFNYKKTHSIVLMAVCNANYQFTMVDIGDSGRNSDGGVFSSSSLGVSILENKLNFPHPEKIWDSEKVYPYVFVGDEAFPLKINLMKPYSRDALGIKERIFNYRLSRCRRIIENTFGILATRFRIFRRPIIAKEEVVTSVTKACVVLHNYLMSNKEFESSYQYCPPQLIDTDTRSGTQLGSWRSDIAQCEGMVSFQNNFGSNNYSRDAKTVRENFRDFFCEGKGHVPWQTEYVNSVHNNFDRRA